MMGERAEMDEHFDPNAAATELATYLKEVMKPPPGGASLGRS
jgi:hypothetical protein